MANTSQELAAAAAGVKSDELGEKVRVHALAKALGIPSAQMITVLGEHGVENKRAASTVTRADVERVLGEIIAAGKPAKAPAKKRAPRKTATKKATGTATMRPAEPEPEAAPVAGPQAVNEPETVGEPEVAQQSAPTRRRGGRSGKVTRKASAPVSPVEPIEPAAEPTRQPATATPATDTVEPTGPAESAETPQEKSEGSASRRRRRRRVSRPAAQETPAENVVQEPAPKNQVPKKQEPEVRQAEPEPEQEPVAEAPRPVVRRRIVRRVGSRSAAAGAEELRRERQREAAAESRSNGGDQGEAPADDNDETSGDATASSRRRRGSRGRGRGRGDQGDQGDQNGGGNSAVTEPASDHAAEHTAGASHEPDKVAEEQTPVVDEPVKLKGSTRLESKRRWRQEQGNEKHRAVTRAEFIARRENIFRSMVVRDSRRQDGDGWTTQVGVVEDGLLVEHFVTSDDQQSTIGNIYLGRVQNVLSSMEAAFIDIGTGRNAVLYASEVDWRSEHVRGRSRRIESALKEGDQVLVQVIKEPLGHKGARLTNRVSFAGRYLVYVPGGRTQGISRKLPEAERKRLKSILQRVVPEDGGTIIRTAAEGVSEEKIAEDVDRLHRRWLDITEKEKAERAKKGATPVTMYEEPNLLVKVVRDMFNEDFNELVVDGRRSWQRVRDYVHRMAPDLESRVVKWNPEEHGGDDAFAAYELDAQLANALSRKIWLPSGGYLIIDKTEAMTVIDVNTGSFVGSGGNLEETVTKNNLEAAEEIVRQMRLRDIGGMIVVDFVDMVLEENRDLLLRRLTEFLAADRTRHKVSEVTSLGLVQMTRKRLGAGLVETYSTECEACQGRGIILHEDPVQHDDADDHQERRDHGGREGLKQARHEQEIRKRYEDSAIEDAPAPAQEDVQSTATVATTVHAAAQEHARHRSDDVHDIVAHALSRAGEEDPDEPTGADYVADETPDTENSDDATEALLRDIVQQEPAEPAETVEASAEAGSAEADVETTRRKDRRGRRVVRRVTPAAERPEVEERAQEAPQAEHTAEAPAADFESAKAEFERSPRRRRRVRGNSRSDREPRPEDYGLGHHDSRQQDSRQQDATQQAEEPADSPAQAATAPVPRVRSDRRGRRRVVRSAR
ncbi:translation initiation factor IF-2 N-terminal domain-containing protein [Corynebacterium sp.]|uniref:translation initiation factor IF-2 N-terminal domain-containing protein n=1 Tax=Corynebacterium sp. TaxID=1720 RepID=UPI0028AEF35F|nr:translation initiation factor IF-2 N-terminal domain-containing protein [Corynebacterium sp.]